MPCFPLFPGIPIIPLSPLVPRVPFFPFRPRSPFSPLGPGGPGGPGGPEKHVSRLICKAAVRLYRLCFHNVWHNSTLLAYFFIHFPKKKKKKHCEYNLQFWLVLQHRIVIY